MSDMHGKLERLIAKRQRHVDNLGAANQAIKQIDVRIEEVKAKIASQNPEPTE